MHEVCAVSLHECMIEHTGAQSAFTLEHSCCCFHMQFLCIADCSQIILVAMEYTNPPTVHRIWRSILIELQLYQISTGHVQSMIVNVNCICLCSTFCI